MTTQNEEISNEGNLLSLLDSQAAKILPDHLQDYFTSTAPSLNPFELESITRTDLCSTCLAILSVVINASQALITGRSLEDQIHLREKKFLKRDSNWFRLDCPLCRICEDGLRTLYDPPLNLAADLQLIAVMDDYLQFTIGTAAEMSIYQSYCGTTIRLDYHEAPSLHIKKHIRVCDESHTRCHQPVPKLPTRVLDLEPSDDDDHIKLHVPKDGGKAQFVVLSHCWGGSLINKLTKDNFSSFIDRISLASLPSTFQDAVIVTRNLGIRYLWIDALCIIQDDPSDWEKESSLMHHVYKSASIMISALQGTDSNSGLVKPTTRHRICVPTLKLGNMRIFAVEWKRHSFGGNSFKGQLKTRGWTLQEEVLARRILYFSEASVIWQCRAIVVADGVVMLDLLHGRHSFDRIVLSFKLGLPSTIGGIMSRSRLWKTLISNFTSRNLTRRTDRLRAVEALAKEEALDQSHFARSYRWGAWSESLVENLLWLPLYSNRGNNASLRHVDLTNLAPSWSWASVDGPISWISLSEHQYRWSSEVVSQNFIARAPREIPSTVRDDTWRITVQGSCISARYSPRKTFPLIYPSTGSTFTWNLDTPFETHNEEVNAVMRSTHMDVYFDTDADKECTYSLLFVKSMRNHEIVDDLEVSSITITTLAFLLLIEVEGTPGVFRRDGVLCIHLRESNVPVETIPERLFKHLDQRRIVLI